MGERRGLLTAAWRLLRARDPRAEPELAASVAEVLRAAVVITNLVGAAAVLAVAYAVVPLPEVDDPGRVRLLNAAVAAVYISAAVTYGERTGMRALAAVAGWLETDDPAGPHLARVIVQAPATLFRLQLRLWLAAAALFAAVNATQSWALAAVVAVTVAITGLTTSACTYLLAERILRIAASRALVTGMPEDVRVPGVATRATLAWALGTAGPVAGSVMIGVVAAAGGPADASQLQVAMIVLGSIGIGVGLLAVLLAARATADPVDTVSGALRRVESGDLEVRVPVYDATQVGRLQLGFNRMVEGLQERERMRTALDVYVDPDVAGRIVAEGVELAGEETDVTIMFIDVRDFTGFAEQHEPAEVLAAVNGLFEVMIPVIHEHDGRVDKFVGDGLMAVFGAPRHVPDHADKGLAAALDIVRAMEAADVPLKIGIGLNSGRVLAGNVGGAGRLEYSVMGDPVNVAARVESATRQTGDTVLLSEHTRERLTREWALTERPGVTLKGKRDAVAVYAAG